MEHMKEFLAWDLEGRKGRLPASAFEVDVHEFDYKGENQIVYEENGVTIRSWPAIHAIEGSVSYSLQWNGLKFVFGGDTYPNKWFNKYAKNADVAIHECMMTPEDAVNKYRFPVARALEVFTQIHTSPEAFGKVMSEVRPRMAIAYHFFTDFDVKPGVGQGIRRTYDGPLSLADDLMVWNVTEDGVTERMAVATHNAWAVPGTARQPPPQPGGVDPMSDFIKNGEWGPGFNAQNEMLDEHSERYNLEEQDWRPSRPWYEPTQE